MQTTRIPPPNVAPRWAGFSAALLALVYAVSKLLMATRGELGMPGHPAPPEAYEDFGGDVVSAQLGNAAVGLLGVAIALALVQRWGRRLPTALLAAASAAALLGGVAGAVVVVASLTGLREDEGQWDVEALATLVPPLVAWVVLTVAAVRAAHAEGLSPRMRALLARGRELASEAWVPGRRAAAGAAAGCLGYGLLKLYWALGGELLLRQTPLPPSARRDLVERTTGALVSHWAAIALAVVGVALAVATVRESRLPRVLLVGLPALLGGLMVARATWGILSDVLALTGATEPASYSAGWDLALWSPSFVAWGTAWILAAVAAWRRTRSPREPAPILRAGLPVDDPSA